MIEVFKTNVQEAADAGKIVALLLDRFPACQASFDLDDCDKILRIAGADIPASEISCVVSAYGFACVELCD